MYRLVLFTKREKRATQCSVQFLLHSPVLRVNNPRENSPHSALKHHHFAIPRKIDHSIMNNQFIAGPDIGFIIKL